MCGSPQTLKGVSEWWVSAARQNLSHCNEKRKKMKMFMCVVTAFLRVTLRFFIILGHWIKQLMLMRLVLSYSYLLCSLDSYIQKHGLYLIDCLPPK